MNLADKLFATQKDDLELWYTVNGALGFSRDDYEKFPIFHCYVDAYDKSVELLFQQRSPRLTREQANTILDLGFDCIYASYGPSYDDGDGELWSRRRGPCKYWPRDAWYTGKEDDENALIVKYRQQIDDLNEQLTSHDRPGGEE